MWVLATPGALLIELLELRAETQDARQQLKNALAESSLAASRHAKEISDQFDMIRLRDQRVLDLERLLDGKRVRTSTARRKLLG